MIGFIFSWPMVIFASFIVLLYWFTDDYRPIYGMIALYGFFFILRFLFLKSALLMMDDENLHLKRKLPFLPNKTLHLATIERVDIDLDVWGRTLNYGTIIVNTTDRREHRFADIKDAYQFAYDLTEKTRMYKAQTLTW